jgi:hypothetical protein
MRREEKRGKEERK